ncbi:hypothetical protein LTR10_015163 [Elasticomyces elasticus]|uniref:N-acetyltransferase domain-containing protein n=1 Tax=Exophiala sideris TaxID=1016849 RepID=A0ABR0JDZ3_9EURO|nr:hypothetical protein LTR10_015163 [Elasticomyces elasticus]KAK5032636.1 hypothetical protein LTS07_004046 [Exophiala sideris]KAK5062161.1 hypothetical protein LTR69_004519 [Exophiala sideris]
MPQASLLSYFPKPVASSVEDRHHPSIKQPQTTKDMNVTEPECSTVKSNTSAIIRKLQENRDLSRTVTDSETTGARDNGRKHADTASGPEPEARKVITDFGLTAQCSEVFSVPHLPEAIIAPVQKAHLPAIQRLTSTTLPVRYSEVFFTSTLTDSVVAQISRVVLYSSDPVGWIRCRLEPCSPRTDASLSGPELSQIYIQALALLSPYRSLGLASILLETILSSSIARASATVCIYAHVWEKNEDALDWYAKRGFKRVLLVEQYYRRLKPSGAWIVRKELDGS